MPFIGAQPVDIVLGCGSIGDDIVDSNHYVDGSIDTAHLGDDQVTEAKIANDAIGLAELKAGTDGEIISWDASGNPVAIGAGTAGHFLKSQGAGSQPVFAAAGGAWNVIGTTALDDDATATITGISTTYSSYYIVASDFVPASNDQDLWMRFGDSSGVDSGASDYWGRMITPQPNNANLNHEDMNSESKIIVSGAGGFFVGSGSGEGISGGWWLHMPSVSNTYHSIYGQCVHSTGPTSTIVDWSTSFGAGHRKADITLDRIQLLVGSGNITSGRMTIWGVAHA